MLRAKRKRQASAAADSSNPKKRKEGEVITPAHARIKHQHRAMLCRVREKTRVIKRLEDDLSRRNAQLEQKETILTKLYQHWGKLDLAMNTMVAQLEAVPVDEKTLQDPDAHPFYSLFFSPDFLEQQDIKEVDDILSAKCQASVQAFQTVVQSLSNSTTQTDDGLRKSLENAQATILRQNEDLSSLTSEHEQAQQRISELDKNLYEKEVAITNLHRQKDRKELEPGNAPSLTSSSQEIKSEDLDDTETWKMLAVRRLAEQDELRQEKLRLLDHLNKIKSQPIPPKTAMNTRPYKSLKFETDKIKQENAALIRKNEWLSRRVEELKQSREAHLKKYQQAATVFKKELAKKVRMFQEELEKYRQKLVVADKERNETRTQIELMGGDRVHLVTELQQLTASQAVELKELREVVKLDKAKHLLYQRLQRQTKIWDEKEADYKRLLSEAKVFTASDGSGSLVEARAAQLKLQEQISKLTNDLNELKSIMNSDSPLKAVMDSKKQLEEELVDQNELSEALMTELDEIAKSLSELQDKNAAFLVQTAEREKKNAKLVSERVKAAHVQSMLRQKNELLGAKLGVQGQAYQSQTRMLKRLEHQATSLKDQLAKSEENSASMQQQLTELKNTEQLNMHMAIDYRGQLEESSQRLEQVQLDLAKQNKSNAALERENRDLREQTVALKRKQRSDVGHGDIEGLEAELSLLKARLRCSVCSHRDQNVIITKCCHTFCRECINENLKVRLRKCPGCGVKFGEDDVKSIFI